MATIQIEGENAKFLAKNLKNSNSGGRFLVGLSINLYRKNVCRAVRSFKIPELRVIIRAMEFPPSDMTLWTEKNYLVEYLESSVGALKSEYWAIKDKASDLSEIQYLSLMMWGHIYWNRKNAENPEYIEKYITDEKEWV